MKSINLIVCRCEPRKYERKIEVAFMNKRGKFLFAIYLQLPIYFFSGQKLRKQMRETLGKST